MIDDIIGDPAKFAHWWQWRKPRHLDTRIKAAAISAGLVFRVGDLLWLTAAGRETRRLATGIKS
jgi:hypothetical protein